MSSNTEGGEGTKVPKLKNGGKKHPMQVIKSNFMFNSVGQQSKCFWALRD